MTVCLGSRKSAGQRSLKSGDYQKGIRRKIILVGKLEWAGVNSEKVQREAPKGEGATRPPETNGGWN